MFCVFRYGPIFREKIINEEFVYVSDPNDIRLLAQNEGNAPCRPSLEVMVESRTQEGLPVGITAMQGTIYNVKIVESNFWVSRVYSLKNWIVLTQSQKFELRQLKFF